MKSTKKQVEEEVEVEVMVHSEEVEEGEDNHSIKLLLNVSNVTS